MTKLTTETREVPVDTSWNRDVVDVVCQNRPLFDDPAARACARQSVLEAVKATLDPRAIIGETGGGCTSIFVPVGELTEEMRGAWPTYWMITQDCDAPSRFEAETQVGFYSWDDDRDSWICFSVPTVNHALELIRAYAGHQL